MAGRPPKYNTVEELQEKIDEYFDLIKVPEDEKDITVHNDNTPTITGLVLYLGFCDRASFYDYEKIDEFSHTIKRARLKVENWYEKCVLVGKATGPIFALKNLGWADKKEIEHSGETVHRTINVNPIKE